MDGHGALGAVTDVQKALCDDVTGRAAVQEEEVVVMEAGVCEPLGLVDLLVEPNHSANVVFPEVGEVGFRRMQRVACRGQRRGSASSGFQLEIGVWLLFIMVWPTHRSLL